MQITKSPNYLIKNPYSYCFRIIIPQDLRLWIGRKELRGSLKTCYLSEAKFKARLLASRLQLLFYRLRKDQRLGTLTLKQIHKLVDLYIVETFEWLENKWFEDEPDEPHILTPSGSRLDFYGHISELRSIKEDITIDMASKNYSCLEKVADELLEANRIPDLAKDSKEYQVLCRELMKVEPKLIDVEINQLMGDFSDKPDDLLTNKSDAGPKGGTTPDVPSITMKNLYDEYKTF